MIDWTLFFRILCRHRRGFYATLTYREAVEHPNISDMARALFMPGLPLGHPRNVSVLSSEWRAEKAAEKEART